MSTSVEPAAPDERSQLLQFSRFSEYGQIPQQIVTKESEKPALERVVKYLQSDIDTERVEFPLIVCFFLTGLIDAGAYNAYGCFVSMMTGNTVFAALGVSDLPVSSSKYAWTKSVVAILAFFLGLFVLSALHRRLGERKRYVLFGTFMFQTLLVGVAALLVQLHGRTSESPAKGRPSTFSIATTFPKDPGFPWEDLIPIALLSFQASDKVLASRLLQRGHLTTTVLTMLYADLLSDPGLFTAGLLENGKRNQRVGGFVFYFIGAVLGGVFAASGIGFAGALWTAAAVNSCLACCWLLWRAHQEPGYDPS